MQFTENGHGIFLAAAFLLGAMEMFVVYILTRMLHYVGSYLTLWDDEIIDQSLPLVI